MITSIFFAAAVATVGAPYPADISIYRGILTGYNKAFLVDGATREKLVDADPRSSEILRPVLRGRDIERYRPRRPARWLIATHNGYGTVPAIRVDDYPAIKRHLDGYMPQLKVRADQGITPYNLRSCAYHDHFCREKVFWIDLSETARFAYSPTGTMYCVNSAYILSGRSLKFLCAVLNSSLVGWFMKMTALNSGMGVVRWIRSSVETIPIPTPSAEVEEAFDDLVVTIRGEHRGVATRQVQFDTAVDELVYGLYGLEPVEVAAIGRTMAAT